MQEFLKKNEKKPHRSFNFTFHCVYDVISLNNSKFGDYFDRICPSELNIKDTADRAKSDLYLDICLEIDSEGRLIAKLSDERGGFNFPIVNNLSICGSILATLS